MTVTSLFAFTISCSRVSLYRSDSISKKKKKEEAIFIPTPNRECIHYRSVQKLAPRFSKSKTFVHAVS